MQPAFFVLRMNYTLQISGCQGFLGYFFHFRVEFSAMIRYNRPMDLKKLLQLALLTGVSMILFLVEAQIPPLVPVPGVKLGLGNIIVVCVLFYYGRREALAVLCVKVLLSALLTGQMGALIYSAAGGLLSLGVMCAVKGLLRQNQLWAASVLGGLSHNVGQLLAAMAVSATPGLLAYLPVLALSGMLTGLFTGLAAQAVVARLRR